MPARKNFQREYNETELARFARHVDDRAKLRPKQCDDGEACWVRQGPPAFAISNTQSRCTGCHGIIRYPRGKWWGR